MGAHDVGRRLLAGLAVLLLAAGCSGSASPTPAPALTPGPTATAAATSAPTLTPTPTATPAPTPTPQVGLTGPLGVGRQIHTATLLTDGGVLVAGGYASGDGPIASATRYDPRTRVFSQTGSMLNARGSHTATLLPDGDVLVAGGGSASWTGGAGSFFAAAELYDPKTGSFKPTGSMSTARESHTATRLADGRVLVAGGEDRWDHAVASEVVNHPPAASARGWKVNSMGQHVDLVGV
jgi:hypothetical protein